MKALLLDSDVLIDILRHNPNTIEQLAPLTQDAILYCSVISVGEIYAGMRPQEAKATQELIDTCITLTVTEDIARSAGILKKLTKTHSLKLDDCLIAATALTHHLTLLTKNIKHYPFKGLKTVRIK